MEKALVVNLFGGPGSGKSTFASGLFTLFKLHAINVEMVTEFAKDLTWEGRSVALDNQLYILGKQYHKMFRLIDKVDVIITDSPLLLSNLYAKKPTKSFKTTTKEFFDSFNNINFFIERCEGYSKNGRSQTREEACEIDEKLKNYLIDEISFYPVDGDYSGINHIFEEVMRWRLHKQPEFGIVKEKSPFNTSIEALIDKIQSPYENKKCRNAAFDKIRNTIKTQNQDTQELHID